MVDMDKAMQRRGFLGSIAKGAAAVGLTGLALPINISAKPSFLQEKSDDSAFESWLGKINGKHKQLFDAPSSNEGLPLAWARVLLMSHAEAGVQASDVSIAIVLRHNAIPLAMENRLWEKYKLGETFKVTDMMTKAILPNNAFWQAKEGSLPVPGMSIDELQKDGVLFGVCNVALTVMSGMVAKKMNMDGAEVKKDWVAGLLPGIQIVPSGVYAVNRLQERGCAYCFAGG